MKSALISSALWTRDYCYHWDACTEYDCGVVVQVSACVEVLFELFVCVCVAE